MNLRTQEFSVSLQLCKINAGRRRGLLPLSGCWVLRCQYRSNVNFRCAVHISKFTAKKSFPMLRKVSDWDFLPASLLFSAACLNTTVKHAVFALFTLERSQVRLRKGKITSSGLQAGIRREIWRLPHSRTFGGMTYFSHASVACLKVIFGLVAAQHRCWVITWPRAPYHATGPQEGYESHLPIRTAARFWCLKQGELNTFYPVSALLQVSGDTSVEMSLSFLSLGVLKQPELEFLAPNPPSVSRGESKTLTRELWGEKLRHT